MPHAHSVLLLALASAPATEIEPAIATRLREMAAAETASAATMKGILDDCAHAALASDFAMRAMHSVWLKMCADEGLPDPEAAARKQTEAAAAAAREESMALSAADLEAALYTPGTDDATVCAAAIRAVLRTTNALLCTGRFREFDAVLAALRADALAPTLAVGVLRYTFMARTTLPHWTEARDRIHAALSARGENADRILRGLF